MKFKDNFVRWALIAGYKNKLDGTINCFICEYCQPKLFSTRKDAREYANRKYGFIKTRKDLREEPHGWRFSRVVKVRIEIEEV